MGDKQSWDCGGTAHILPAERAKATFAVEKLTNVLDGSAKSTTKRRWIISVTEGLDNHLAQKYFWTRDEALKHHVNDFIDAHKKFWDRYVPTREEVGWMSENSANGGSLMNHYGLFLPTIMGQSSSQQLMEWLPRVLQMKMIGSYAQTELGHGSNVRGLQTIAEYDKAAQNFVLSTPTLQSMKWWPGALAKVATHAAVYAQLVIDGKEYGIHCFVVQIRDENHKPLPGIELGELGPKCGDHANDTGYMRLRNVRVPRTSMLSKLQHVEPNGTYVKSSKKTSDKAHYATMVSARGGMTKSAGGKLAIAVTIATRYSCVRQQGFADTSSSNFKAPERFIIDYQVQRYRILKQLALTYAMKFTGSWLIQSFSGVDTSMRGGQAMDSDSLQEVFATSSGLKALCTFMALEGIEDLRKCCGGNGYLLASGIGALEGDYKWQITAEGDFVILTLQTARFLVKSVDTARSGQAVAGLCEYLAVLADPKVTVASVKPAEPASPRDFMDLKLLTGLWRYRAMVAVVGATDAFNSHVERGMSRDDAWNACSLQNMDASKMHCLYSMLTYFVDSLNKIEDEPIREVLGKLCALFACTQIIDGNWTGMLSLASVVHLRNAIEILLDEIRPNCVALVDAFEIPDRVLNSAIGRYDGNVYEALYTSAKNSPMNRQDPFEGYGEVLKPYLDLEYLYKGRLEMAREAAKAPASKL
eukprot:c8999_g1_i1.p1 GENE.c8999_g1_i1~~c8999_g1_i1.p1  ORF type:complete len:699 (+),score=214.77 c8999_g1_i1:63-2159(+)